MNIDNCCLKNTQNLIYQYIFVSLIYHIFLFCDFDALSSGSLANRRAGVGGWGDEEVGKASPRAREFPEIANHLPVSVPFICKPSNVEPRLSTTNLVELFSSWTLLPCLQHRRASQGQINRSNPYTCRTC